MAFLPADAEARFMNSAATQGDLATITGWQMHTGKCCYFCYNTMILEERVIVYSI